MQEWGLQKRRSMICGTSSSPGRLCTSKERGLLKHLVVEDWTNEAKTEIALLSHV